MNNNFDLKKDSNLKLKERKQEVFFLRKLSFLSLSIKKVVFGIR